MAVCMARERKPADNTKRPHALAPESFVGTFDAFTDTGFDDTLDDVLEGFFDTCCVELTDCRFEDCLDDMFDVFREDFSRFGGGSMDALALGIAGDRVR